jgi:hypothetical protein
VDAVTGKSAGTGEAVGPVAEFADEGPDGRGVIASSMPVHATATIEVRRPRRRLLIG